MAVPKDEIIIGECKPPGYSLHYVPRTRTPGGGVELLYRNELQVKHCNLIKLYTVLKLRKYVDGQVPSISPLLCVSSMAFQEEWIYKFTFFKGVLDCLEKSVPLSNDLFLLMISVTT